MIKKTSDLRPIYLTKVTFSSTHLNIESYFSHWIEHGLDQCGLHVETVEEIQASLKYPYVSRCLSDSFEVAL